MENNNGNGPQPPQPSQQNQKPEQGQVQNQQNPQNDGQPQGQNPQNYGQPQQPRQPYGQPQGQNPQNYGQPQQPYQPYGQPQGQNPQNYGQPQQPYRPYGQPQGQNPYNPQQPYQPYGQPQGQNPQYNNPQQPYQPYGQPQGQNPQYYNPQQPYQPYGQPQRQNPQNYGQPGPYQPYVPQRPMPSPEAVQKMVSKNELRKASNRASLAPIFITLFPQILLTIYVFGLIMTNMDRIMMMVERMDITGIMNVLFQGGMGQLLLLSAIVTLLGEIPVLLIARATMKRKIFAAWKRPQGKLTDFLLCMVMMLGAGFAGEMIFNGLQALFGKAVATPNLMPSGPIPMQVGFLLYVCILGPIMEEAIFRGMVLQSLRPWGNGLAIAVTSVLFGLTHMNLGQGVAAVLMGLVLGYTAVKFESILPGMLLHILNNCISMLLTVTGVLEGQQAQVIYFVIMGIALAGTVLILVLRRRSVKGTLEKPVPDAAPPVEHKYRVAFVQSAAFWVLVFFFVCNCASLAYLAVNGMPQVH